MTLCQEVTAIGIVASTVSVQKISDKFAKKVQVMKWHKGTEAKITVQMTNRLTTYGKREEKKQTKNKTNTL